MQDRTDYTAAAITRGGVTLALNDGQITVTDHPHGARLTIRTRGGFSSVVMSHSDVTTLLNMLTPPSAAVDRAVEALGHFGVDSTTPQRRVRQLLATWAHFHTLTAVQIDQVITAIRDGAR